eukprot:scaffold43152_cov22-Tisochrysis_lutea.AAC.1
MPPPTFWVSLLLFHATGAQCQVYGILLVSMLLLAATAQVIKFNPLLFSKGMPDRVRASSLATLLLHFPIRFRLQRHMTLGIGVSVKRQRRVRDNLTGM